MYYKIQHIKQLIKLVKFADYFCFKNKKKDKEKEEEEVADQLMLLKLAHLFKPNNFRLISRRNVTYVDHARPCIN